MIIFCHIVNILRRCKMGIGLYLAKEDYSHTELIWDHFTLKHIKCFCVYLNKHCQILNLLTPSDAIKNSSRYVHIIFCKFIVDKIQWRTFRCWLRFARFWHFHLYYLPIPGRKQNSGLKLSDSVDSFNLSPSLIPKNPHNQLKNNVFSKHPPPSPRRMLTTCCMHYVHSPNFPIEPRWVNNRKGTHWDCKNNPGHPSLLTFPMDFCNLFFQALIHFHL